MFYSKWDNIAPEIRGGLWIRVRDNTYIQTVGPTWEAITEVNFIEYIDVLGLRELRNRV